MKSVNKEIGILNGYFDGADIFELEDSIDTIANEYLEWGDLFSDESFMDSDYFSQNKAIIYH